MHRFAGMKSTLATMSALVVLAALVGCTGDVTGEDQGARAADHAASAPNDSTTATAEDGNEVQPVEGELKPLSGYAVAD